ESLMSINIPPETEIIYPETDGQPMAENTLQWDWIVKIVGELREQYAGQDVFVAGDLFWYPVEGDPKTVTAPDILVVFGRPAGYRGSYRQWLEGGLAPQVVFEVLSPSNTDEEMAAKLAFFERFGVEEYYVIDPYTPSVEGYHRQGDHLFAIDHLLGGFTSPRLGIRFERIQDELRVVGSDGREFQTREDRVSEILLELQRTSEAFEQVRQHAIEESRRADEERRLKELLVMKLRELGINPDDVLKSA
ncbi:MAG: Uma2 family endonuclease, partial [Bacteroidales bacterium]|nr:Uma2 family endonuclease [Bacteroidales bacterium]